MKKKHQKIIAILAAGLTLGFCACGRVSTETTIAGAEQQSAAAGAGENLTYADMFSSRDKEAGYDETETVTIRLSGSAARSDGANVTIAGSTVTVTGEGTYLLTGSLENGSVVVDAGEEDKVQLVLENANISNSGSAPLYVKCADKVVVTLADGSENTLSNTGEFAAVDDNNVDACIFSKEDLTFNGGGSLTVTSETGHGVVSKDSLVFTGGSYTVNAARHALAGKDDVRVQEGSFSLTCGQDALHASNDDDATLGFVYIEGGTFEISAADDGIHAESELLINGGSIKISECCEGLEGNTVTVNGGEIYIKSSDDGVNAAGGNDGSGQGGSGDSFGTGGGMPGPGMGGMMMDVDESCALEVNGGRLVINAEGDGLDSNGSLLVSGGEVYISGPTNAGNGTLDYGTGATITGGVVIAADAGGMAENFGSASTQGSMLVSLSGSAGTPITVTAADGSVLATFTPEKDYRCAVISAPGIAQGQTCTVTAGSESKTVEMTSLQYSELGGMGGMGGKMGGGQRGGEAGQSSGREGAFPGGADGQAPTPPEDGGNAPNFGGQPPQRPDGGSAET